MLVSFTLSLLVGTYAVTIPITNSGFESDDPDCPPNSYWYYSDRAVTGWTLYDPNNIMKEWNKGILNPAKCASCDATHGVSMNDPVYGDSAPEGNAVLYIAHIAEEQGNGESGVEQTLSDTLAPRTIYTLTAKVGNPGSNCWTTSTESTKGDECYDRIGSTGYIMQLLAGDTILAQDNNSIYIDDYNWAIATVQYITASSHSELGNALKIRLMQQNGPSSSGSEVNFDDVDLETSLTTTASPTAPPSSQPTQTPTKYPVPPPTYPPTQSPTKYPTVIPTTSKQMIVSSLAPIYSTADNPSSYSSKTTTGSPSDAPSLFTTEWSAPLTSESVEPFGQSTLGKTTFIRSDITLVTNILIISCVVLFVISAIALYLFLKYKKKVITNEKMMRDESDEQEAKHMNADENAISLAIVSKEKAVARVQHKKSVSVSNTNSMDSEKLYDDRLNIKEAQTTTAEKGEEEDSDPEADKMYAPKSAKATADAMQETRGATADSQDKVNTEGEQADNVEHVTMN